jgi:glycosyltransferase involved in cell wall biosynthesis
MHVLRADLAAAGLALAEHWGIPYIATIDEFPAPSAALKFSRHWCRGLVVPVQDLADALVDQFGVPRQWVRVVPPGIVPPDSGTVSRNGGRVPVIGTAGSLGRRAGLATFLAAARRVVDAGIDAEFVVAGHGQDEANVRLLAGHLGIIERVTFVEERSGAEAFWRVLDIYCQPSLQASAGRDLITALGFGHPAVVSDVAGLRSWVVPNETGVLVPPGDTEALAAAILGLLADPELCAKLGLRAREHVAQHNDPSVEVESLRAVYQAAIGDTRSGLAVKPIRYDSAGH